MPCSCADDKAVDLILKTALTLEEKLDLIRKATRVQSIVFDSSRFTAEQAQAWARQHGFGADKTDTTDNTVRLRQFEPGQCREGTFGQREVTPGVQLVFCETADETEAAKRESSEDYGGAPGEPKRRRRRRRETEVAMERWRDRWPNMIGTTGRARLARLAVKVWGVERRESKKARELLVDHRHQYEIELASPAGRFGFSLDPEGDSFEARPKFGFLMDRERQILRSAEGPCLFEPLHQGHYKPVVCGDELFEFRTDLPGFDGLLRFDARPDIPRLERVARSIATEGLPDDTIVTGRVYWPRDPRRPAKGLRMIDVSKTRMGRIDFHVLKRVEEQRFTLGVVYPPKRVDAHGDWMETDEVQRACWLYTVKSRRVGLHHKDGTSGSGTVVESYIHRGPSYDHEGQRVDTGAWLLGVIWQPRAWAAIKSGEVRGYSLQGWADRVRAPNPAA